MRMHGPRRWGGRGLTAAAVAALHCAALHCPLSFSVRALSRCRRSRLPDLSARADDRRVSARA